MKKNHEFIFWNRIHGYTISSTILPNNGCKYKICQVKKENDSSKCLDMTTLNAFVKESRFIYIRPVDGATRLVVYNCSTNSKEKIIYII